MSKNINTITESVSRNYPYEGNAPFKTCAGAISRHSSACGAGGGLPRRGKTGELLGYGNLKSCIYDQNKELDKFINFESDDDYEDDSRPRSRNDPSNNSVTQNDTKSKVDRGDFERTGRQICRTTNKSQAESKPTDASLTDRTREMRCASDKHRKYDSNNKQVVPGAKVGPCRGQMILPKCDHRSKTYPEVNAIRSLSRSAERGTFRNLSAACPRMKCSSMDSTKIHNTNPAIVSTSCKQGTPNRRNVRAVVLDGKVCKPKIHENNEIAKSGGMQKGLIYSVGRRFSLTKTSHEASYRVLSVSDDSDSKLPVVKPKKITDCLATPCSKRNSSKPYPARLDTPIPGSSEKKKLGYRNCLRMNPIAHSRCVSNKTKNVKGVNSPCLTRTGKDTFRLPSILEKIRLNDGKSFSDYKVIPRAAIAEVVDDHLENEILVTFSQDKDNTFISTNNAKTNNELSPKRHRDDDNEGSRITSDCALNVETMNDDQNGNSRTNIYDTISLINNVIEKENEVFVDKLSTKEAKHIELPVDVNDNEDIVQVLNFENVQNQSGNFVKANETLTCEHCYDSRNLMADDTTYNVINEPEIVKVFRELPMIDTSDIDADRVVALSALESNCPKSIDKPRIDFNNAYGQMKEKGLKDQHISIEFAPSREQEIKCETYPNTKTVISDEKKIEDFVGIESQDYCSQNRIDIPQTSSNDNKLEIIQNGIDKILGVVYTDISHDSLLYNVDKTRNLSVKQDSMVFPKMFEVVEGNHPSLPRDAVESFQTKTATMLVKHERRSTSEDNAIQTDDASKYINELNNTDKNTDTKSASFDFYETVKEKYEINPTDMTKTDKAFVCNTVQGGNKPESTFSSNSEAVDHALGEHSTTCAVMEAIPTEVDKSMQKLYRSKSSLIYRQGTTGDSPDIAKIEKIISQCSRYPYKTIWLTPDSTRSYQGNSDIIYKSKLKINISDNKSYEVQTNNINAICRVGNQPTCSKDWSVNALSSPKTTYTSIGNNLFRSELKLQIGHWKTSDISGNCVEHVDLNQLQLLAHGTKSSEKSDKTGYTINAQRDENCKISDYPGHAECHETGIKLNISTIRKDGPKTNPDDTNTSDLSNVSDPIVGHSKNCNYDQRSTKDRIGLVSLAQQTHDENLRDDSGVSVDGKIIDKIPINVNVDQQVNLNSTADGLNDVFCESIEETNIPFSFATKTELVAERRTSTPRHSCQHEVESGLSSSGIPAKRQSLAMRFKQKFNPSCFSDSANGNPGSPATPNEFNTSVDSLYWDSFSCS